MEAAAQQLVPSPSSPDNAIVSPETLSHHSHHSHKSHYSHHSSPAKSSRILNCAQHVTIDETTLPPSLRSSQHLLLQHSRRSTPTSPPPTFHQEHETHSSGQNSPMNGYSNSIVIVDSKSLSQAINRQKSPPIASSSRQTNSTTQHLAVLYETHHHLHPILSPARRPSRLPDTSRFLAVQQQQQIPAPKEIKA